MGLIAEIKNFKKYFGKIYKMCKYNMWNEDKKKETFFNKF